MIGLSALGLAPGRATASVASRGGRGGRGRGRGLCWNFRDSGTCAYGDACRFAHTNVPSPVGAAPVPYVGQGSLNNTENKVNSAYLVYLKSDLNTEFATEQAMVAGDHNCDWILDSGCTCHMCNKLEYFVDIHTCPEVKIYVADGTAHSARSKGTVRFTVDGELVELTDALYVPTFTRSLMSVKTTTRRVIRVIFGAGDTCVVRNREDAIFLQSVADAASGLYELPARAVAGGIGNLAAPVARMFESSVPTGVSVPAVILCKDDPPRASEPSEDELPVESAPLDLWHRRLAHVSTTTVKNMARYGRVLGLGLDDTTVLKSMILPG